MITTSYISPTVRLTTRASKIGVGSIHSLYELYEGQWKLVKEYSDTQFLEAHAHAKKIANKC